MRCVGIDGAGSGWLAVWEDGDELKFKIYKTVPDLASDLRCVEVIAVDIPIGLSEHAPRAADRLARSRVGGRRACSIFAAPLRGILHLDDRCEASALHRELDREGQRGFGVQSFALLSKIRDWDSALRADSEWAKCVFEVHPEVSFAELIGGQGLAAGKKTRQGHQQRRTALGNHYGVARVASLLQRVKDAQSEPQDVLKDAQAKPGNVPKRAKAKPDDVLDALAAYWSAQRIAAGTAGSLPTVVERDACGLRMAIYY